MVAAGVARKWLESVAPDATFDDIVRGFRQCFGTNDNWRTEMLTVVLALTASAADEPVGIYIEEMASLVRRMQLDNDPLMRQGIIQGLCPEMKRDVMLQKHTFLEALAEAAAIGEVDARTTGGRTKADEDRAPFDEFGAVSKRLPTTLNKRETN